MFEYTEFADQLQELSTLPRALVRIDGIMFVVCVYPTDFVTPVREVAMLMSEQSSEAKTYLSGVLDKHQAYHDRTAPPGLITQVERRYILRTVPGESLRFDY